MIKSYLKLAVRNIKRQKIYSAINIAGLTVGLSICLVIFFYVLDDLTFDRFHKDGDSVFRLVMHDAVKDQNSHTSAITSGPLLPAAKEGIPEVIGATRASSFGQLQINRADEEKGDNNGNNAIRVRSYVADSGFFDVFSFKILSGETSSPLESPNGVYLSPETAEALFGEENPLGRPLQLQAVDNAYVAGIIEAPPTNSHIQFDVLIPLRVERNPVWWDSWENQTLSGYLRLQKNSDPDSVAQRLDKIAHTNGFPDTYTIGLQPLLDVHLGSDGYLYDVRNFGKKNISVVYTLSVIGIMILLIASINFINLSSARAAKRAREVGIRKVVGSKRWQLIGQFLGESIILTTLAMVAAILIVELTLPHLENFLGKQLDINFWGTPWMFPFLLAVAVLIGLFSGIYPAFILSAFRPVKVLKGEFHSGRKGVLLRRFLVIFQFTISIALIVSVFTVKSQIDYLRSKDMGYSRDQVLVIPNFFNNREDILKTRLHSMPGVLSLGRTSQLVGDNPLRVEVIPEGSDRTRSINWPCFYIDEGFFKTLNISMASGRAFSKDFSSDVRDSVIINESALRLTGWKNPIGKRIELVMEEGNPIPKHVVGVVRDFHFSSARQALEPMAFLCSDQRSTMLLARLAAGEIIKTRDRIEVEHGELFPERDFRFFFLDDIFDQQFNDDREFASHLGFFSSVAIFIACLGLLGLVSFAVEQRRKEIAVRKVLGSSETRIMLLLAVDFLKWVTIANLIAWPLGYFSMDKWVNEFIYQAPFSIWPFVLSGTGAIIIALVTVSFQSLRAARSNPADTLRQDM